MLVSVNYASDGLPSGAHAREIALAAEYFPFIETFQVVVGSLEALDKVEAFRHLRSLSVSLATNIDLCDVDSVLRRLLTRLPGLETLRLERCNGLRLSAIAKLCPNLKYLRLVGCAGSMDDVPLNVGAFPNLEVLEISMVHRKVSFIALFLAIRNTLRTARFCHDDMCVEFLHYCAEQGERLPFQCLEELTLETGLSLPALELEPGNLHDVLKALPALRHLETDSYDLRLFFENYCVPPGRVSLSWLTCVFCAVHKPADPQLERIKKISKAMMSSSGKAGNSSMS
ncbi:hypothetical protein HPB51_003556 [Rhipicephalus microplus]|uniref:Uncharacterized protein n=1 Tax=Rhipicephalus microplus TaxID=6941 RepID=A0A9J6E6I9_RHIMP|nr:hypothetical protein HPB51_003556 [Rhipicephalus microplus]